MSKSKLDWLIQLRRCSKKETLETIINNTSKKLEGDELTRFLLAADHRLAEIEMGRLYDKIPASVWQYVK